jgi:hypothetical protein
LWGIRPPPNNFSKSAEKRGDDRQIGTVKLITLQIVGKTRWEFDLDSCRVIKDIKWING